jgi:hypothetical protein
LNEALVPDAESVVYTQIAPKPPNSLTATVFVKKREGTMKVHATTSTAVHATTTMQSRGAIKPCKPETVLFAAVTFVIRTDPPVVETHSPIPCTVAQVKVRSSRFISLQ